MIRLFQFEYSDMGQSGQPAKTSSLVGNPAAGTHCGKNDATVSCKPHAVEQRASGSALKIGN